MFTALELKYKLNVRIFQLKFELHKQVQQFNNSILIKEELSLYVRSTKSHLSDDKKIASFSILSRHSRIFDRCCSTEDHRSDIRVFARLLSLLLDTAYVVIFIIKYHVVIVYFMFYLSFSSIRVSILNK